MLLNSGAQPTLVGRTAEYAGVDLTQALPRHSEDEIKEAVNAEWALMREQMGFMATGETVEISYASTVANQALYARPTGFIHMEWLGVAYDGKDVSDADSGASITEMAEGHVNPAAIRGDLGDSEPFYYLIDDSGTPKFGLTPIPTKAGTNSIKMVARVEASSDLGDSDSPPAASRATQELLCMRAAQLLRGGKALPSQEMERNRVRYEQTFLQTYGDRITSRGQRAIVGGRSVRPTSPYGFGRIKRVG